MSQTIDYSPTQREQIIELKDGRTLFKTSNGFKSFMENKKGEVIPVTKEYYSRSKKCKK